MIFLEVAPFPPVHHCSHINYLSLLSEDIYNNLVILQKSFSIYKEVHVKGSEEVVLAFFTLYRLSFYPSAH